MKEPSTTFDAIIIGAGFAGMYQLKRLRDDLGLNAHVFERGSDVGGTWFWNRYPGARCDVESVFYSYSFSEELQQEWEWTERYPAQPELLDYARHVADRFGLRQDISFDTAVNSARFDEARHLWTVATNSGSQYQARYLITAVGCLSASRIPDFPGLEDFTGAKYHTGHWPHEGVDFTGRRVAVIGTGSSGIQAIPMIAQQAQALTVFQRTANFSVPAHNRSLTAAEQTDFKANYPQLRTEARDSASGVVQPRPIGRAMHVAEEARNAELERRWSDGGIGFLTTFEDTGIDEQANAISAQFVRDKIAQIVDDPATAQLLMPSTHPIGTKRLCVDTNYYATYNRDNVTLVSVRDTPIDQIMTTGIRSGGTDYEVDDIVFATGYDAITGALNQIEIVGRDGKRLSDKWAAGPRTYLGVATAGFPNLFILTGPGSPSVLSNFMVSIEQHVDWVTEHIADLRRVGAFEVEADQSAEDDWVQHVHDLASHTLLPKTASWFMGANIPGKPRVFMPYVGGVAAFREHCDSVAREGYRGFTRVLAKLQ